MNGRRKDDRKRAVLDRAPTIPSIAETIDQCLQIAASTQGGTARALVEIDKVFKPDKLCDCQPGQCRRPAEECKDWNKRGQK